MNGISKEEIKMKYCPNCGTELAPGSVSCPRCGSPVQSAPRPEENPAAPVPAGPWTIREIKDAGYKAFRRNYWNSVLAGVIFSSSAAIASQLNPIRFRVADPESLKDVELTPVVILLAVLILAVSMAVTVAVDAFGAEMLRHASTNFMRVNQKRNAGLDALGAFSPYLHKVFVLFMKNLFLFLWSCLLIIPGIVKSYEYRMVHYILQENPEIGWKEALQKSKEMMDGSKWQAFLLDLSFIGWALLSCLTCFLLGLFFLMPYKMNADAALYERLKAEKGMG